jgi:hypothetical protein
MGFGRSALAVRAPVGIDRAAAATVGNEALYQRIYPYYAEICALSEIRKRPGFGAEFSSGMGGHSILYLSGVYRDRGSGYPRLKLCSLGEDAARHGVGISVNSHYRNANWVAAEGRDFVFRGLLGSGEPLTRAAYHRTQEEAKSAGILDGVQFHEHLFRDKPAGMSKRDYMYDISVATDYAVGFGRDIYRARVPLDRPRMAVVVDYLNGLNAPYRAGSAEFRWNIFNNNCSHVAHNALAKVGIWTPWPTGQFAVVAAFKFPVPKNEFVDLALRTNDMPIDDPAALYADAAARQALVDQDVLPTAPGALVSAQAAVRENEVYDTDRLRLIFYDNPFWGPYRPRLSRIFRESRYFDLRTNLHHFCMLYEAIREKRAEQLDRFARSVRSVHAMDFARFLTRYERHIDRATVRLTNQLAALDRPAATPAEALS